MLRRMAIGLVLLAGVGTASAASMDDVAFWTGSGSNQAVLVIDWSSPEVFNNTSVPAPIQNKVMAWGYRFDGQKTGEEMLNAILAADSRLFVTTSYGGTYICGFGYDLNRNGTYGVTNGVTSYGSSSFVSGKLDQPDYDADAFHSLDSEDIYWAGVFGPNWEVWQEQGGIGGFFQEPDRGANVYWMPDDVTSPWSGHHGQWTLFGGGYSAMELTDGSWLGLSISGGGLEYGNDMAEGTIAYNFHKQAPANIPEPASLSLLAIAGASLIVRRRHA